MATAISPGTPVAPTIRAEMGLTGTIFTPTTDKKSIMHAPKSEFSKNRKSPFVLREKSALIAPTANSPIKKASTVFMVNFTLKKSVVCKYRFYSTKQ